MARHTNGPTGKNQVLKRITSGVMLLGADGSIEAVSSVKKDEVGERFAAGSKVFEYFDTPSVDALQTCMTQSTKAAGASTCWPVCTAPSQEVLVYRAQIVSFLAETPRPTKYALRWRRSDPREAIAETTAGYLRAKKHGALSAQEVAHDLNNLLTTIVSFAGFLMDDLALTDIRRSDAQEILEAAEQATQLTERLLESEHDRVRAIVLP